MQLQMRAGTNLVEKLKLEALDWSPSPILRAAWCETQFLLRPNSQSALQLLESYVRNDMVLNIFVSHWTYKAATFLLSNAQGQIAQQGYHLGWCIIDRCALKWHHTRALQRALETDVISSKQ